MPKYLGEKWKRVAEAASRESAVLAAIQTAGVEQLPGLLNELSVARTEKVEAREGEDVFTCAWHQQSFTGARVVFEVTGVFVYDKDGGTVSEQRSRLEPLYFVACPQCEERLSLVRHLGE